MSSNTATGTTHIGSILMSGNSIANSQAVWSNATIKPSMTLDSSGNLGIGTGYAIYGRDNMIVFRGQIEVERAANGFVVRIGTRQGDVATTYVAKDVSEVNGIITAEMVKFKLEDK